MEASPQSLSSVYTALVHKYLSQHMLDSAAFYAEQLVAVAPPAQSEDAAHLLALCHMYSGRHQEAEVVLSTCKLPANKYLRAKCAFQARNYAAVEEILLAGTPLARLHPDTFVASVKAKPSLIPGGAAGLHLLASAAEKCGLTTEAVRSYRLCLEVDPWAWTAHEALCRLGAAAAPEATWPAVAPEVPGLVVESASRRAAHRAAGIASDTPVGTSTNAGGRHLHGPLASPEALGYHHGGGAAGRLPLHPPPASSGVSSLPPHRYATSSVGIGGGQGPRRSSPSASTPGDAPTPIPLGLLGTPATETADNTSGMSLLQPHHHHNHSSSSSDSAAAPSPLAFPGLDFSGMSDHHTYHHHQQQSSGQPGMLGEVTGIADVSGELPHLHSTSVVTPSGGVAGDDNITPVAGPGAAAAAPPRPQRHAAPPSSAGASSDHHPSVAARPFSLEGADVSTPLQPVPQPAFGSAPVSSPAPRGSAASTATSSATPPASVSPAAGTAAAFAALHTLGTAAWCLSLYRIPAALQALSRLPAPLADTPTALTLKARALHESHQYAASRRVWEALRASQRYGGPARAEGLETHSSVLWHLKAREPLAALARACVQSRPDAPQTWCVVGNLCSLTRDHAAAVAAFDKALARDPRFAYAHVLAGHERLQMGDTASARVRFAAALGTPNAASSINPHTLNAAAAGPCAYAARFGLGMCELSERPAAAEAHFRGAIALNPCSATLHCCLGLAAHAQGKLDAALTAFDAASRLDPGNLQAAYHRGLVLAAKGLLQRARNELAAVAEAAPRDATVLVQLAKLCARLGDTAAAVTHLTHALQHTKSERDANAIKGILMTLTSSLIAGAENAEDLQALEELGGHGLSEGGEDGEALDADELALLAAAGEAGVHMSDGDYEVEEDQ